MNVWQRRVVERVREVAVRELGTAWAGALDARGVPRGLVDLAAELAGVGGRAPLPVPPAPVRVEVRGRSMPGPRRVPPGRVELAEVLDEHGAVVGHTTVEVGR